MSGTNDNLEGLEKHRQLLEENIAKLRKGLQHWRQWDAEYETLKEEIESLPKPVTQKDLSRLRSDFQSAVIDKKEMDEIFGHVGTKPAEHIISLLSRRIDYVTKNIETLETQLIATEDKLAALEDFDQHVRDEDGLPLTEIIEELDEEGNVLSSRLQKPGDSTSQVRQMLEQAGVKKIPSGLPEPETPGGVTSSDSESKPSKAPSIEKVAGAELKPLSSFAPVSAQDKPKSLPAGTRNTPDDDSKPKYQTISLSELAADDEEEEAADELPAEQPARKKSVAFTDDTKAGEELQKSRTARRVEEIMRTAREQEQIARQPIAMSYDESEEDAFLRSEMLKYGMSEVGAVVAELTLEEGTDNEDEGFDEMDYTDEDEDEDDDEDKYGRYTGSLVDDDYRQRMLELEKKLGVKSRFTEQMENDDSDSDAEKGPEGLGRIVINREPTQSQSGGSGASTPAAPLSSNLKTPQSDASKGKKSVSFATALDIAPEKEAEAPAPAAPPPPKVRVPDTISTTIVERTGPSKRQDIPKKKPKKVSRFKQHQTGAVVDDDDDFTVPKGPLDMPVRFLDQDRPVAPSGPKGRTIAESLVERESTVDEQALADANEEFIDQGVADEYYRKRNEFIHRHGGFLQEDESQIQPLDEADGGRRISKFKAARLSKQ